MKVYIVTEGEYSDFTVRAVFEDKKAAQVWCATHTTFHGDVLEFDTNEHAVSTDVKVYKLWNMFVPYDMRTTDDAHWDFERYLTRSFCSVSKGKYGYVIQATTNRNANAEKAKKILFDKLAEWKYENEA